jgi:hypothetical protein
MKPSMGKRLYFSQKKTPFVLARPFAKSVSREFRDNSSDEAFLTFVKKELLRIWTSGKRVGCSGALLRKRRRQKKGQGAIFTVCKYS